MVVKTQMRYNIYISIIFLFIFLLGASTTVCSQNLGEAHINNELDRAEQLILEKKYDQAVLVLEDAFSASFSIDYYYGVGTSNYLRGDIKYAREEHTEAYSLFWKALSIGRLTQQNELEFEAAYRLGNMFYIEKIYDRALDYYMICDSLIDFYRTKEHLILLNEFLAITHFKLANFNESKVAYYELLKFSLQYQDVQKELIARKGIADCYVALFEFEHAIEFELTLFQRYKALQNDQGVIQAYSSIALYYSIENKPQKSEEFYKLVLDHKSIENETKLKSLLLLSALKIHQLDPQVSEIKPYLDKALSLSKKMGLKQSEIKANHLFSFMYYVVKEDDISEEYLGKSLELLDAYGDLNDKKMVYQLAIRLYEREEKYMLVSKYQGEYIAILHEISEKQKTEANQELKDRTKVDRNERIYQLSTYDNQMVLMENERVRQQNEIQKHNNIAQNNRIALLQSERENRDLTAQNEREELIKRIQQKEVERELEKARNDSYEAQVVLQNDSIQRLKFEKKMRTESQRIEKLEGQRGYLIKLGALVFLVLILLSFFFFTIRKTNKKLAEKNTLIEKEHNHTEQALIKLKKTQTQLVESERLASLGQLTAGIAHEIRNPLNFVNNFSKLNLELAGELNEEILSNIKDKELLEELSELVYLLSSNSNKINEHGERAARIITQMLDSSRHSDHVFKLTDIKQFLEESTKLAYQGVRGEEVDFSANIIFDFDPLINEVNIVAQDFGRVIINLVNNACYAMLERKKLEKDYLAELLIKTILDNDKIVIIIQDNGMGMSKELVNKIFDPFFTTKPAGKGTGLGLTMSFDIITKVHQGELLVDSEEKEYTRFTISIPNNLKNL